MKLKDKIQHALDESRMLILGVQILVGFNFQVFLMVRFDALPVSARRVTLFGLALLGLTTLFLFAPVSRHRLIERGEDSRRLHEFTQLATCCALFPFAAAIGCEFYVIGIRAASASLALGLSLAAGLAAMSAWTLLPWITRRKGGPLVDEIEAIKLNDKIRHVLTEARVVLPGTQALLGFQLAAAMQDGFEKLPLMSKQVHLASLAALGISIVLLMLPAAYHRIAESGELSERLHRISSHCILAAMVALSAALAGDAFIVVRNTTSSVAAGAGTAAGWFAASLFAWFAWPVFYGQSQEQPRAVRSTT